MNQDIDDVVIGIFKNAVHDGDAVEPSAVSRSLLLAQEATGSTDRFSTEVLEEAIHHDFPFIAALASQSKLPLDEEILRWTQAVRWLHRRLHESGTKDPLETEVSSVLFTALGSLDIGRLGLASIVDTLADTCAANSALKLLSSTGFDPSQSPLDDTNLVVAQLLADARAGDLEEVKRGLRIRIDTTTEFRIAVFLASKLCPSVLAKLIVKKGDFFFSSAVCQVLGDQAPLFALDVPDVPFKLIGTSSLRELHVRQPKIDADDVLVRILMQVADTSHWRAWLEVMCQMLNAGSIESRALGIALTRLDTHHWSDFIDSVELTRVPGYAETLAEVLTPFLAEIEHDRASCMWQYAFERWDAWDYGRKGPMSYLNSPLSCALDLPVAMYYADLQVEERLTTLAQLEEAIRNNENQWFTSPSELSSQHHRLVSRLRLVRHGEEIAAGRARGLPPPAQAENEYIKVRYRL